MYRECRSGSDTRSLKDCDASEQGRKDGGARMIKCSLDERGSEDTVNVVKVFHTIIQYTN